MLDAIWRAYATYNDKDNWNKIVTNDMNSDFGWEVSAKKYADIYKNL